MENIILSIEQTAAMDSVLDFIYSKDELNGNLYLLSGCAGSGKTTVTVRIVRELQIDGKKVAMVAPTNEAARILAEKSGGQSNGTIYSLMGLVVKEIDDKSIRLERKGKSTFKDFDIIVIDEASMVNDELFDMILEECARFNNKILFVGDSHQLPPVNNPNGMSKAFTIKMKSELTEIKRVQEKNPIIKTVTVIRKQIFSGNDAVFERVDDRNEEEKIGIRYMDKRDVFIDEMLDLFSSNKFQKDDNYVRALAYTNKEVSRLNNSIRERIYGDDSIEFEMGERLIAMSPLIRDDVIVINTGDRMRVTSAREIKASNCDFIAWDLGVSSPFFGSKTLRVVSDKSRDFFDGLLASMADTARKAGSRHAWSEYFMFKNQFANINYSYATTVHKAQGSTFQNVYVNERDINTLTWNNVERNKLKYVAFTRASHNLVILN